LQFLKYYDQKGFCDIHFNFAFSI